MGPRQQKNSAFRKGALKRGRSGTIIPLNNAQKLNMQDCFAYYNNHLLLCSCNFKQIDQLFIICYMLLPKKKKHYLLPKSTKRQPKNECLINSFVACTLTMWPNHVNSPYNLRLNAIWDKLQWRQRKRKPLPIWKFSLFMTTKHLSACIPNIN